MGRLATRRDIMVVMMRGRRGLWVGVEKGEGVYVRMDRGGKKGEEERDDSDSVAGSVVL